LWFICISYYIFSSEVFELHAVITFTARLILQVCGSPRRTRAPSSRPQVRLFFFVPSDCDRHRVGCDERDSPSRHYIPSLSKGWVVRASQKITPCVLHTSMSSSLRITMHSHYVHAVAARAGTAAQQRQVIDCWSTKTLHASAGRVFMHLAEFLTQIVINYTRTSKSHPS